MILTADIGNTNITLGESNKTYKQTQSVVLGGSNTSGKGSYTYIVGQGNNNNKNNGGSL